MGRGYANRVDVRYSAQQIEAAIERLAGQLTADLSELDPVVVVLLKGSFMFAADLIRKLDFPLQLEFLAQKSYFGRQSSGVLEQTLNLTGPVRGRHVLVVDDISDTAYSIDQTVSYLKTLGPASLRTCCLLERIRSDAGFNVDYVGIRAEPGFLIGYGLDLDQEWRNLPFIGLLEEPDDA